MAGEFYPVLIKSRLSHNILNPSDVLFVTLTWQNQGSEPAQENYEFTLDIILGHQRHIENKQYNFRVAAPSFPPTTLWAPGETVDVTLRWEVMTSWSGTFHICAGCADKYGNRIAYLAGTDETLSYNIGFVDVGWNLGRPWVAENAIPVETQHSLELPRGCSQTQYESAITLKDDISVVLESSIPRIKSMENYHFNYSYPQIIIRNKKNGIMFSSLESDFEVRYSLAEKNDRQASYDAYVCYNGQLAVSLTIHLNLNGRVLSVSVSGIKETEMFELISVSYLSFAEMSGGYLLDFFSSGRLARTDDVVPAFFTKKYDVRNAGVLYDDKSMIIAESLHLDSTLTTGVYCANAKNVGFIGGGIVCKIPGSLNVASIKVKTPPVFTIEFCDVNNMKVDWTTAAKFLRRGVNPNSARDLYRNTYFYKQLSTFGPLPSPDYKTSDKHILTQNLFKTITFDQITEAVKSFSNLTDNVKQVMYITGFQKGGFDAAYPYPFDAEERCGGWESLKKNLVEIRKYNCLSGLHDNFDDVSVENINDFPYTAIDEYGKPWRGWVWAAGLTYAIGTNKYVNSGEMAKRVERMNATLPLEQTYHIDVLTAEPLRYDFDSNNPASAEDSFRAKAEIINEWNKYGIDVTSELLVHPAVGKIGFALHTRLDQKESYIPGDCFVPLVQMIYHGTIGYTCPSTTTEQILWGLLLGGQTFHEMDITGELCVSRYFIQNVPAMLLYDHKLIDFVWEGSHAKASYENNSWIEVDFIKETYKAVIDGELVGQNFSVFYRGNSPDSYLAYSFNENAVTYTLPECLRGVVLRCVTLTIDGEGEILSNAAKVSQNNITLTLPKMTPVKITAL